MGKTLTNFMSVLRIDLGDTDVENLRWSDDEISRSISMAVSDLSRYLPRELVYEETLNFTVENEEFITESSPTWVSLANAYIKPKTETVSDDTKTYTRDSDYTIDYSNGLIKYISSGTMSANTTYRISYTKSKLGIDISNIDNLHRITRVQYPIYTTPQQFVSFNIYGNYMYVGSQSTGSSQTELSDKEHIAIWYETEHNPPTLSSSGTYPSILDQLISIGAAGYALMIKSLEYEHSAADNITDMETVIGNLSDLHNDINGSEGIIYKINQVIYDMDSALNSASNEASSATTALGKINNDSGTAYLTLAATNIGAYDTLMTDITSALDDAIDNLIGDADSAKSILGMISTHITNAHTAINEAVDSAKEELGWITTKSLDKISTGAESLIDSAITNVSSITPAPEADRYSKFSESRVNIAMARVNAASQYINEANARLADLASYISQSNGYVNIANGLISNANQMINAGQGLIESANGYISIADRYISEASIRVNNSNIYITEADGRFNIIQAYIREAEILIYEMDRYMQESGQYAESVQGNLVISDRYRTEGQLRLNEFHNKLQVKSEYRKRTSSVPIKQPL